jgi:hypothetical protein
VDRAVDPAAAAQALIRGLTIASTACRVMSPWITTMRSAINALPVWSHTVRGMT